jgi:hypothetical protein
MTLYARGNDRQYNLPKKEQILLWIHSQIQNRQNQNKRPFKLLLLLLILLLSIQRYLANKMSTLYGSGGVKMATPFDRHWKNMNVSSQPNTVINYWLIDWFLVFNATFSNISAISWRPVLVVEEAEYLERTTDHGQATGKLYHLRLRVQYTLFVIYKAGRETTPYWW